MERAVIVKGRVTDGRHIELEETVEEMAGREVEVTVRTLGRPSDESRTDTEGLLRIGTDWRAHNPDRLRSKEDIDRYLDAERASWGEDER
jgi:hypothetical protein